MPSQPATGCSAQRAITVPAQLLPTAQGLNAEHEATVRSAQLAVPTQALPATLQPLMIGQTVVDKVAQSRIPPSHRSLAVQPATTAHLGWFAQPSGVPTHRTQLPLWQR